MAFFANTNLITYQNFYYFFKDLGATAEAVDIFDSDSVSYPTDGEQSFTLYRKGLAVAGNSSVTVFSATGRQIVSASINYQNPVAVGAGKYLLVYELGGTEYSLYNSNIQIHSGETEYVISSAAVSDSGMYALVSASSTHTSVVSLYSSRFSLLNKYNLNDYVMDIDINAKGDRLGILCTSSVGGSFSTRLLTAQPGKGELRAETVITDALGLSCAFTASGKIAVLCSDGVYFLSDTGKTETSYAFDGFSPMLTELGTDGVAVTLKKNTVSEKNIVIIFDKNGKMVYNESVTGNLDQLSRAGDSVFWTTEDGIWRLNLKNKTLQMIGCITDQRVILAVSEDEVLSCSPQKASYIVFQS
ncbi:MAG: hypothetical protein IJX80_06170 [Clostridia bacterium]|nr:hypothetical protein [Clostridia bacterium]